MTRTSLLTTVCAVTLLAAAPAIAQTQTPDGSTGNTDGTARHTMHHQGMDHAGKTMHGESATSQDGAVDDLNSKSYAAAQRGQPFNANGPAAGSAGNGSMAGGSDGMMKSGGMGDMSRGSTMRSSPPGKGPGSPSDGTTSKQ